MAGVFAPLGPGRLISRSAFSLLRGYLVEYSIFCVALPSSSSMALLSGRSSNLPLLTQLLLLLFIFVRVGTPLQFERLPRVSRGAAPRLPLQGRGRGWLNRSLAGRLHTRRRRRTTGRASKGNQSGISKSHIHVNRCCRVTESQLNIFHVMYARWTCRIIQ